MKYYSEKTNKLYDTIEQLKAEEDSKETALLEEITAKHFELIELAKEFLDITNGKELRFPEVVVKADKSISIDGTLLSPDGSVDIKGSKDEEVNTDKDEEKSDNKSKPRTNTDALSGLASAIDFLFRL